MTLETLNLVICNMVLVKGLRSVSGLQDLPFVMALEATILLYTAVSGDDVPVASFALDLAIHVESVIEIERDVDFDVAFCFKVTGGTAGDVFFLPLCLVEVADKTLDVGHRDMSSLNDLGMTGGAAELLFPLHLL